MFTTDWSGRYKSFELSLRGESRALDVLRLVREGSLVEESRGSTSEKKDGRHNKYLNTNMKINKKVNVNKYNVKLLMRS